MIRWLLDTNVISETRKPQPSREVATWIAEIDNDRLYTSAMSIAELRYGAGQLSDQLLQVEISNWIEKTVRHGLTTEFSLLTKMWLNGNVSAKPC